MQLFLRSTAGKTIALQASPNDTIASIKSRAAAQCNCEENILFFFAGQCLNATATLEEYGIQNESTIQAVMPVEGGKGKKKKKKVFTKPKKPIHRHKLEKMRALKYFKVTENDDGSYKVEHARDECPNPTCGSGIFMAQHKGRKYCGKCHLTYAIA